MNFTSLKMLASKKMIKDMPYIDHLDKVYESCVLIKHHKTSFAKEVNWKANKPPELVYTDVCGPIKPLPLDIIGTSLLSLMNIVERHCFNDFKVIIEKQSDYNIRTVRYDQGGEYTSNKFEAFCTQ